VAVEAKIVNGIAILTLNEKLIGGDESQELRDNTLGLISDGIVNIVLDLSGVNMVNSAGIGVIIGCHTSLINRNGQLKIACVSNNIMSLLTITRLHRIFDIYKDVDEAVESFGN